MVLADADSVFQLLVGLNLAYFSFREIRSPALSQYLGNVTRTRELLSKLRQDLIVFEPPEVSMSPWTAISSLACKVDDSLRQIRMGLSTKEANLRFHTGEGFDWDVGLDAFLRPWAMVVATMDFAILIYAALRPTMQLWPSVFMSAVGISCLPAAFSIWFNWLAASTIRYNDTEVRKHRHEIEELNRSFRLDVVERTKEIRERLAENAARGGDH